MPTPAARPSPDAVHRRNSLDRLAARAHDSGHAEIALAGLHAYDALERQDLAARQLTKWSLGLAAGYCLAVFPFTPGLIADCSPHHNPGWLCGARSATFAAAVGVAIFVGVRGGQYLWRGRHYCRNEAARLAIEVGRRCGGGRSGDWPVDLLQTYHEAGLRGREDLKALLIRPPDGVVA